ncbi:uncharacterized protein LOC119081988 [Bradysia coprophila]|uniref:uncharacterized protein LOC119081988 n=1 Tax=Bradysia coprophila TaxID=38358 RepID=UPI00187D78F7|nr:uncharacterized protein LOC119081988 [Bradysia coprophila]
MAEASEDVLKFVLLVEQHIDVLLKSQTVSNKEKKKAAAASIIQKWEQISKVKSTDASLLKKISNLKTRAKAAQKSGKPMNDWQIKILRITSDDLQQDAPSSSNNQIDSHEHDDSSSEPPIEEMNVEQILNQFETDQTKSLSIEQLQRLVLLQKLHVLTLQRSRLENLNSIESAKSLTIDYIGFDDALIDDPEQANTTIADT